MALSAMRSSIQTGIRDADHDIRVHRVSFCEKGPSFLTGKRNIAPLYDGVRPRKIDVFKDAEFLSALSAMGAVRVDPILIDGYDLARQQFPRQRGTNCVQRAGFGSEYRGAVRQLSHAKRTEAIGVSGCNQLCGRGDHQRVCAFDPIHSGGDCCFNGRAAKPLLYDDIGENLRIGCGMENRTCLLQRIPQFHGIGKISIMCQCHAPLVVVDDDGLHIALVIGTCGGIADMADYNVAPAQRLKLVRCKHLV